MMRRRSPIAEACTAEYQWTRGLNSYTALVGQGVDSVYTTPESIGVQTIVSCNLQNGTGTKAMETENMLTTPSGRFGLHS